MAEMQVIFQLVAIEIILTVEVQCCFLFRAEHIVKIRHADSAIHYPVHLVCRDTAGRAAADIVDVSPETLLKRTVVEESAEVLHRTRQITVGAVFKYGFIVVEIAPYYSQPRVSV